MVDFRESSRALRGIEQPAAAPDLPVLVRPIFVTDLPWVHGLFKKRYPAAYDWHTTYIWFCHTVLNNPLSIYAARTRDAFILASIITMPWLPQNNECNVVTICADDDAGWQVVKLQFRRERRGKAKASVAA